MANTDFRNLALIGHQGTGKTTLAEALLLASGAIQRKGSIAEKNTVSDFDLDEKERGGSVEAGILHLDRDGQRVNLLDCPGTPDFVAGVIEGLAAAETALIAVNAAAGVEVMTRKLWGMVEAQGLAKVFVLTQMDHDRANFDGTIKQLKDIFGAAVTPLFLPLGSGAQFSGVFNLLEDPAGAPAEVAGPAKDLSGRLIESVISADEALMERYLMDEKISKDEVAGCFAKALLSGDLVPVLCASAEKDLGIREMLDVLFRYTPAPSDVQRKLLKGEGDPPEERALEGSAGDPFYALVFKSKRDPFIGKISYLRVFSGALKAGGSATSSAADRPDKFPHFLEVQGKETREIEAISAGAVFAVAKNENLNCGDTLSGEEAGWRFPGLPFPEPMSALAVKAKSRKDEGRISEQLRHLAEGDPTFKVDVDSETKELVIRGTGQLHLDLMLQRLKRNGVEVETKLPKIPYRSTITGTSEVRYRHKKQTGGAGQFGEVQIKLESNSGEGYEFLDEIVGGVIPNTLIPSVNKGITKKLSEGVWPGIPVVDVKVHLNDGKFHPVDSKDIAFQIAGREAFKQAFEKAKPVLIEPVVGLEIMIPSRFMGDITGLISGKRGRIQGMDQMGDLQVVRAQAPAAEVQSFAAELKSITGGEGFYSMSFSHYDTVPGNLAQPVINAAQKRQSSETS